MTETSPPHPKSILRGHKAQVHVLSFVRGNARLLSGDAEGFVVFWDLTTLRPVAVWRPHEKAILGIQGWGDEQIITHGRDNKLIVWKLGHADEDALSKKLPLDESTEPYPQPWLLHLIEVNTMNFCSFASCSVLSRDDQDSPAQNLVAVPNTLASESIDIYELPSQSRRHTVKSPGTNGMVMALRLFHQDRNLTLIAGYENGVAAVLQHVDGVWKTIYKAQSHSQPVLSLDASPSQGFFLTSSADSNIVKHPVPPTTAAPSAESQGSRDRTDNLPIKVTNTKHSGQQSLSLRDDARIFATGGWDNTARIYSSKTLKEVAVLKWHQVGCYAVAFADVSSSPNEHSVSPPVDATTSSKSDSVIPAREGELSVRDRRIQHAQSAHWVATGSKDGKVALWEVF